MLPCRYAATDLTFCYLPGDLTLCHLKAPEIHLYGAGGGGGHKKAAGATITGYTKEEAEALLLGIMEREISSATPV